MTTLLRGGEVFDGTGGASRAADVLVVDGVVREIGPDLQAPYGAELIDATRCWVTPGFIDIHTHYDAELEVAPALSESLRHGVTTTLIGSCGLSMVVGEPEDMADMFCRVEGIPRDTVLPLLEDIVDWDSPKGYLDHLDSLPLGPNLVAMAGHSTIRAHVMGLGRSLDASITPDSSEMRALEDLVHESVDAGYLGMSANLLPWDKMGGTRYRSRPTPSVFARFSEYRALGEVLRSRGALFQAIPNLQTRWTVFPLLDMSRPRKGRPALRTSLLTLMDAPPAMGVYKLVGALANFYNDRLGADVRFQSLPTPFDMYTDGLENPVLEEIGAGTEALHLEDLMARRSLMRTPAYRDRFRREWRNRIAGRAYHRDLAEATVVSCPDATIEGRTFADIAASRAADPLDTFLDLQGEYGNELRWYTVVGNGRPGPLEWIMDNPSSLIGFSDAGAHLRNMAFYNYPLRMLKRVRDAELAGRPFMSTARAVHRLTGEIADFLRIDAGRLRVGSPADIAVVNPEGLDDAVEEIHEVPMEGFGDLERLVRRNDDAMTAVLVNGRVVWDGTATRPGVGEKRGFGRVLRGEAR